MSRATRTMLFATSLLPEKMTLVALFAGMGVAAMWWAERDGLDSNRPIPAPILQQTTETTLSRPQKDDVLAVQPRPMTEDERIVAGQAATDVPIPTILRKQGYSPRPSAGSRGHIETARYDRCMPACETRDPLVASNTGISLHKSGEISPSSQDYDNDVIIAERTSFGDRIMSGGTMVVSGAANASKTAYDVGRSTVIAVVDFVR